MTVIRTNDDEVTKPGVGHVLNDALTIFARCLFDLGDGWIALSTALKTGDAAEMEIAARALLSGRQDVEQQCQNLEAGVAEAMDRGRLARAAVQAHDKAIGDLFQRALEQTAGSSVHAVLRQMSLQLAAVESLPTESSKIEAFGAEAVIKTELAAP